MKRQTLETLSEVELLEKFVEIALQQERAQILHETRKFRPLFQRMKAVELELQQRANDQRQMLTKLFSHENMHVRMKAAQATLAIDPIRSRLTLEQVASSRSFPAAGDAGMSLWALDRGIFKPT